MTRVALAALALGLVGSADRCWAWSQDVHALVSAEAVQTLPKGLKEFFSSHLREMPTFSEEAKAEDQTTRHFEVDRLLPFPFAGLPRSEAELRTKYGPAADDVGRLPWLIDESMERLVVAFRSGDKAQILAEADVLAALVADVHNPLALTENRDGQKTHQNGLWTRFAVRFYEASPSLGNLQPDAANYLDDPKEYVFSMVNSSYIWVDNLLYADDLARRGLNRYSSVYYEQLQRRVGHWVRERLSEAAEDVGSYWYTAWSKAGRPALR